MLTVRGLGEEVTMLDDLREEVAHMCGLVQQAVARAEHALLAGNRSECDEVLAGDDLIDHMELSIAARCGDLLISARDLADEERREMTAILKVISDLERVADLAEEIALISRELSSPYPAKIDQRLRGLAELTLDMVQVSLHAFLDRDPSNLRRLREQEDTSDVLQRRLHAEILCHLKSAPDDLKTGVNLLFASHNLGRMADHATNIGEWAIYRLTGGLGRLRHYHPSDFPASHLPLV
jgi:phosphate transport system protein